MNVKSVNEDEDFPVFKAGPPIPIRTKTKSKLSSRANKTRPLKAVASLSTQSTEAHATQVLNVESKVKKYIENVKASDELGRKKRIKPEQMLSLEDLYQVSPRAESQEDEGKNSSNAIQPKQELSITQVQDKLRKTLRIVKEKDELINKLRESCHDLAIKCADAENRVDELRFSYARLPSSASSVCIGTRRGTLGGDESDKLLPIRRTTSEVGLNTCDGAQDKQRAMRDVQTQIGSDFEGHKNEMSNKEDEILQETCSNWMEKIQNWKTDSNFNLSQDSGGDRDSGFRGSAEIDMESVRRQHRHSSLPRSRRKCQEHHPDRLKVPSRFHSTQSQTSPSSSATITVPPLPHSVNQNPQSGTTSQEEIADEELQNKHFWPSCTFSQSHFHLNHLCQNDSSGTKAKSLFYEIAEADRNKYCNQHSRTRHRLCGAKSLDALNFPREGSQPTSEELRSLIDSSLEPPESILKAHLNAQHRSMEKTVKMLDPLLDDATEIALRVRKKSERLAQMLHDACTFD